MNAQEEYYCDPCKFVGRNVLAVVYCRKCEGSLCKSCMNAHKKTKDNKTHKVIDVEKAMENVISKKCDIHRCPIESVCETHDVLCCRECIAKDHRLCHGFVPLQRAAEGIHGTKLVQETTKELEQLIARSTRLTKEEQEALNGINIQDKNFDQAVKKFRKDVILLLDRLEETLLHKKNEICKDEKAVVQQRLKVCEVVSAKLTKAGEQIQSINKTSEDQTAFIVMKKSREVIDKYGDVVEELIEGKGKFSIKFQPNNELVKAADCIGSINVKSTVQPVGAYDVKSQTEGRKLTQVGALNVSSPSDKYPCTITGCALLGDSRLVLADETNYSIKVLNNEFKLTADLKMDFAPWDIAAISRDEVAVRCSFSDKDEGQNTIAVVKIGEDSIKKERQITVDGRPRAIKHHDGKLYVACSFDKKAHILVLNKDLSVTKTIKPKTGVLNQPQYLAIAPSSDAIYISDFYNGIIALNMKGDVMFKFKDSHVTEYGGITLDTSGDLFICAGKPYGIYHVAKDGKSISCLTTWENGSVDPQAIMYNQNDEKFLVTCCTSNNAYIYSYVQ